MDTGIWFLPLQIAFSGVKRWKQKGLYPNRLAAMNIALLTFSSYHAGQNTNNDAAWS